LKWLVMEGCRGMNGGTKKALGKKCRGIVIVEDEGRIEEGVDFRKWQGRIGRT